MNFDTSPESSIWSLPTSNDDEQQHSVAFASFGGAVLDDIRIGSEPIARDSLGGAGTHAIFGARLFLPPGDRVAWQLQTGEDFPIEVESRVRGWGIRMCVRRLPGVSLTRNLLTYHDHTLSAKTFQYQTPLISVAPKDLQGTAMLSAKVFHFHVHPDALLQQIRDLHELRELRGMGRPLLIWEPTRPSCVGANLGSCLNLAKLVDVFSPKHDELAALYGMSFAEFCPKNYESLTQKLTDAGIGPAGNGIVVVRAGEHGVLLQSRTLAPTWLPAFYQPRHELINPKVVDTTGAGNSFPRWLRCWLSSVPRCGHSGSVRFSGGELHGGTDRASAIDIE